MKNASARLLLGLDVGTTGCKAVLVNDRARVVAAAAADYALSTPRPLWAEQNPADWWRAAVETTRSAMAQTASTPDQIAAIGVTGQMHGLVLLDARGEVLRPAILWNDQRTGAQCAEITARVGRERLLSLTANEVLPGFTAPKLMWVRENEPDVYAQIAHVLLPKDYLRFRLTGTFATDVTDASGTSLLNVAQRRWSSEMLDALDIRPDWLPRACESTAITGAVSHDAAAATGLREGTPVVAGAGDQAAQAIGAGIIADGDVSVTIGTSGVVFAACRPLRRKPDGRLHAFCHAAPDTWHLMGVMLAAGGALRWYRDALCAAEKERAAASGRNAYAMITTEAAAAAPGCEGLLFLPYLSGERTPYADPDARGVFFGLSLRHKKSHLTRAILEGVAFGLRDSLELIRATGVQPRQIRLSGGGARSELWRQILADVFATDILATGAEEGAAFGAALLAGVGSAVFQSIAAACPAAPAGETLVQPGPASAAYDRLYPRYRSLYAALRTEFQQMAALYT